LRIAFPFLQEIQELLLSEPSLLDGVFQETNLEFSPSWNGHDAAIRHLDIHMIALTAALETPCPRKGPDGYLSSYPP